MLDSVSSLGHLCELVRLYQLRANCKCNGLLVYAANINYSCMAGFWSWSHRDAASMQAVTMCCHHMACLLVDHKPI